MLVLTREAGQSIIMGDDGHIKVKVLTNDGRHIRLGIDAPKKMSVNREEVHRRLQRQHGITENADHGDAVPCHEASI